MTREDVLQRLADGTFNLSFSKLTRFAESPHSFMRFCTDQSPRTKAMKYGSAAHCAALEPDIFPTQYIVEPEGAPRKPSRVQLQAKKPSEETLRAIEFWKEFEREAAGREVMTRSDYNKALDQGAALRSDRRGKVLLENLTFREEWVEGKIGIWPYTWKGKVDGIGQGYKIDLKFISDATPRKAAWTIIDSMYHIQGWIYNQLRDPDDEYFVMCVDGDCEVSIHRLSPLTMTRAAHRFDELMMHFERCVFQRSWDESHGFWTADGHFEL